MIINNTYIYIVHYNVTIGILLSSRNNYQSRYRGDSKHQEIGKYNCHSSKYGHDLPWTAKRVSQFIYFTIISYDQNLLPAISCFFRLSSGTWHHPMLLVFFSDQTNFNQLNKNWEEFIASIFSVRNFIYYISYE